MSRCLWGRERRFKKWGKGGVVRVGGWLELKYIRGLYGCEFWGLGCSFFRDVVEGSL